MVRPVFKVIVSIFVLGLMGCGGEDSDSSQSSNNGYKVGTLFDSPVRGVRYTTESTSGVTNAEGAFSYLEGESVTFHLDDMLLGQAYGAPLITPIEITGLGLDQAPTTNLLRLLQSYDSDCNTANGISVEDVDLPEMAMPDTKLALENDNRLIGQLPDCADGWRVESVAVNEFNAVLEDKLSDSAQTVAFSGTDPSNPNIIVDNLGNSLTLLPGDSSRNELFRVFMQSNSNNGKSVLTIDDRGLPKALYVSDGTVALFDNYSNGYVDLIVSSEDGESSSYRLELSGIANLSIEILTQSAISEAGRIVQSSSAITGPLIKSPIYLAGIGVLQEEITQETVVDSVKAISTSVRFIDEVEKLLKVKDKQTAFKYVLDQSADIMRSVGWNATVNNVGFNSNQIAIANITYSTLQCAATATIPGCVSSFEQSALKIVEFGGELYDSYEDFARIERMASQLLSDMEKLENRAPAIEIRSPADGDQEKENTTISFSAVGSDAEDGNLVSSSIRWQSSVDGSLGTGFSLNRILSVGTHVITATATDSEGKQRVDKVSVDVRADKSPVVEITSPGEHYRFSPGETIFFSGTAEDEEDGQLSGQNLVWTDSVDNRLLGTGSGVSVDDLLGFDTGIVNHVVRLTATDSQGQSSYDEILVSIGNVSEPESLKVEVQTPVSYSVSSEEYTMSALVFADGKQVVPELMEWVSNRDGRLGLGTTITTPLSLGTHNIVVNVYYEGKEASTSFFTGIEPASIYNKIDDDGLPLDAGVSEWSCVEDFGTGLIWEAKTTSGLHSNADSFSFYSSDPEFHADNNWNSSFGDSCYEFDANNPDSFCNTEAYVKRVNDEKLCGYSDWRLPTESELLTILIPKFIPVPGADAVDSPPADPIFFPNTEGYYWTSTKPKYFTEFNLSMTAVNFSSFRYSYTITTEITYDFLSKVRLVRERN